MKKGTFVFCKETKTWNMQDRSQVLSSSFPVPGNTGAIQVTCLHTLQLLVIPVHRKNDLKITCPWNLWHFSQAMHNITRDISRCLNTVPCTYNQSVLLFLIPKDQHIHCLSYTALWTFNPWPYTDDMQYYSGTANITSLDLGSLKIDQ